VSRARGLAQPGNGNGDAYRCCRRHRLRAIPRKWTVELVIDAMLDPQDGRRLPSHG